MAYRLVFEVPKGERGLRRRHAAARDAALRAVAEYWVEKMLPGHFRAGAEQRYRYPKRTDQHMRRKRREGRGQDPNVYTGGLRDKMIATEPRVKVDKRGVTLVWPGLPKYTYVVSTMEWVTNDRRWDDAFIERLDPKHREGILKWRAAHPQTKDGRFKLVKRPNKVAEITAIDSRDAKELGRVFKERYRGRLRESE